MTFRAKVAVCTLLLSSCGAGESEEPSHGTKMSELAPAQIHMQIVAHEDDDFLFMNPDLQNIISAGHGIVTVYLTAGQASGAPATPDTAEMCAAEFATARQNGVEAVYAQMTGLPNIWTRDLFVPDPGVTWPHTAERYTLNADPRIRLIFLNLPDAGAQIGDENYQCAYPPYTNALSTMFENPGFVTNTLVPSCGPVAQGYGHTSFVCKGKSFPDPFT